MRGSDGKARELGEERPRSTGRKPRKKRKGGITLEEWLQGVLYGLINASICLPASISFSTIIFQHEAFAPYLPVLVRLVLLSSAVHATVFVALSSMPFAVGQVQVSLWRREAVEVALPSDRPPLLLTGRGAHLPLLHGQHTG